MLAFATSIPGLDVTHAAFAYRDAGRALRVLHAPLSGGVVEVTRSTLPEYVAAIRRATGSWSPGRCGGRTRTNVIRAGSGSLWHAGRG